MDEKEQQIKPGRPRIEVDYDLIIALRQVEGLGWKRAAAEYSSRTGQKISKDTYRRRYFFIKESIGLYYLILTAIKEHLGETITLDNDEKLL